MAGTEKVASGQRHSIFQILTSSPLNGANGKVSDEGSSERERATSEFQRRKVEFAELRRKAERSNKVQRMKKSQDRFRDQKRLRGQGYGVDFANTTRPALETDPTGFLPIQ